MSNWVIRHYRFRESQDSRWDVAFDELPARFALEIICDFSRSWLVLLPTVAASMIRLSSVDQRVENLGNGWFLVPDEVRPEVAEILLNQTRARGRWWSLRSAAIATPRAQLALEALL